MSGFFSKASLVILLLSSAMFTGCGGGGGGGGGGAKINTVPAAVDTDNAEAIGKAAGEAIQVADASSELPTGIVVNDVAQTDLTLLNNFFIEAAISTHNAPNLPAGIDVTADTCTSGTASITTTGSTGPVNATMQFNNCVLIGGLGFTVTGKLAMHFDNISDTTNTSGLTFTYTNFTIKDISGTTTTVNMIMDCPTGLTSCTFSSDFVGADGVTHRVTNFNFSGNATLGFNGTVTFFHGTHGRVDIIATTVTYGSCGSYPDGGTVTFDSSDGSSGTIIFNADCTTSGTWSNSAGSGSF